jgi:hypothetical protein
MARHHPEIMRDEEDGRAPFLPETIHDEVDCLLKADINARSI